MCGTRLLSALVAAFTLSCTGCCLSRREADARLERLRADNWARAEPAMRAAAQARGAVLLPLELRELARPLPCAGESDQPEPPSGAEHEICLLMARESHTCTASAADGSYLVLRQPGERPKLVIPVPAPNGPYTRVARRGDTVFILRPEISPRIVGHATQCECDGMPRVICPMVHGFVLDDVFVPHVEELSVPMTEDQWQWSCKAWAV
jgi:hypothetical protein